MEKEKEQAGTGRWEMPPVEWFRDRFSYDRETGRITGSKGDPVGTLATKQRRKLLVVTFRDPRTRRPRVISGPKLAFALELGRWPTGVRQLNGDMGDLRWANLVEVRPGRPPRSGIAA